LIGEIEIVDGLQKGKMRAARQPSESRLLTMRDLLCREQCQEVPIGPSLSFRPIDQAAPQPAGIREVQPLEKRSESKLEGDLLAPFQFLC